MVFSLLLLVLGKDLVCPMLGVSVSRSSLPCPRKAILCESVMVDELALEDEADEEEEEAEVMSISSVAAASVENSEVLAKGAVPEQLGEEVFLNLAVGVAGVRTAPVTARGEALEAGAVRRPGSTLRMELRIPMVRVFPLACECCGVAG